MRSPSLTKEMTPLQFARARLMLVLNLILLYTPVMIIMSHVRLNKITPIWALMIKIDRLSLKKHIYVAHLMLSGRDKSGPNFSDEF